MEDTRRLMCACCGNADFSSNHCPDCGSDEVYDIDTKTNINTGEQI